jgi:hypothetical protein
MPGRLAPEYAFIPTTVAMPIIAHEAICQQMMRTVNRAGFWAQKQLDADTRIKSRLTHGFDMSKLTPSSLFYLPCQAQNPRDSFFIDHNTPGRVPLDPYRWAGYAANHHRPEPEPSATVAQPVMRSVAQPPMPPTNCPKLRRMRDLLAGEAAAKVQNDRTQRQAAAIQKWRAAPAETGNRAFFQLGVDLGSAGLSMAEIENSLRLEAENARHPTERRGEVNGIMRTLRGSSRRMAA